MCECALDDILTLDFYAGHSLSITRFLRHSCKNFIMFGYDDFRFPANNQRHRQFARKAIGTLHPFNPVRVAAPRRQRGRPSMQPENYTAQKRRKTDAAEREENAPGLIIPTLNVISVDFKSLIQTEAQDVTISERVLSTPAVWTIIGKYLNFSDLKACRLVSTKLNRLVMDETDFVDRAIVNVKPNFFSPMEFGRTKEAWKNMMIPINCICSYESCNSAIFHDAFWLLPLLTEVEELIMAPGISCSSDKYFEPSPAALLNHSPKLAKLTVHPSVLRHDIFSTCSGQLSKLTHFKVSNQSPEHNCSNKLSGLQQLLRVAKNLKVFESSVNESSSYYVPDILLENQASLVTLKYYGPHLWEPEGFWRKLRSYNFPALRIFQVTISLQNMNEVIQFLKMQPPLEEIELDLRSSMSSMPLDVLDVITAYHGSRLRALRIDALDFSNILTSFWRFLKTAPLKEFSLWPLDEDKLYSMAPVKHDNFMAKIFQYLPPTIQKIRLHGSNSKMIQSIPIQHLLHIDPKSLTHLCLSRIHGAIAELTLKYIFRNFTMLRVLHLANLDDSVTDLAFIAKASTTKLSTSCLADLKGLRSLTLRKCGKITDLTLTEGIKFQELQYLDLSFNPEVTVDGCVAVAQQNRSLECFVNDHITMFPSEETRRVTFPRLTSLKNWTHDADIVCVNQQNNE